MFIFKNVFLQNTKKNTHVWGVWSSRSSSSIGVCVGVWLIEMIADYFSAFTFKSSCRSLIIRCLA